jgi:hypothetical protein
VVVIKNTVIWDITPCSLLKVNRRFGRTYRLHLQGLRISRARTQRDSRIYALLKRRLIFNVLPGVISQ